MHEHAEHAAEAAEAAVAQGKFWEMHASLYHEQSALEDADLLRRVKSLGLDVARFEQELTAGTHTAHVHKDFQSGVRGGVNGTPTSFIDGVRHDGDVDVESLVEALTRSASSAEG